MHIHNRLCRMTTEVHHGHSDPSLTGLKLPNSLGGMVGRDEEIQYWPFCNGELQQSCQKEGAPIYLLQASLSLALPGKFVFEDLGWWA